MFDETISILSLWASMHSWLTPTVLFLLLNLMIGTIALTSYKPHNHHHHHHDSTIHLHQPPQITRAPSILQRLKSINFHSYHPHSHPHPQPQIHGQPAQEQQKLSLTYDPAPKPAPKPVPLPRIEEVRAQVQVHDTLPQEDTLKSIDDIDGPTMDEIYSRIKDTTTAAHRGRKNSDTNTIGGEIPVKLPAKMKKSASHKSPFNHFQPLEEPGNAPPVVKPMKQKAEVLPEPIAVVGGDEEVDSKADDFINKFKQHLKLQRVESIVRYKGLRV